MCQCVMRWLHLNDKYMLCRHSISINIRKLERRKVLRGAHRVQDLCSESRPGQWFRHLDHKERHYLCPPAAAVSATHLAHSFSTRSARLFTCNRLNWMDPYGQLWHLLHNTSHVRNVHYILIDYCNYLSDPTNTFILQKPWLPALHCEILVLQNFLEI